MNIAILQPKIQAFIREKQHADPRTIALSKSPFSQVTSAELAQQIQSRQHIRKKLPSWYAHPNIYYPPLLALEQCSSERAAAHKARLLQLTKDSRMIDLTGGFGVDTFYFSKAGGRVTHCEIQPELSAIAHHNLGLLDPTPVEFLQQDGVEALLKLPPDQFEFAYIDPSRRIQGQKVVQLQTTEPNILEHQKDIQARVRRWMVKAAPLLDISSALKHLNHVQEVHVIGFNNEVKELLFILERDWSGPVQIQASRLLTSGTQTFAYSPSEERIAEIEYGDAEGYLYEPDAVIMKAGCFKLIAKRFALKKLHPNTHLYTAPEHHLDFPGKVFAITGVQSFGAFKKQKVISAASVVSRNFPIKAHELRSKFNIPEDPQDYLFFFKDRNQRLTVSYAQLVS